MSQEPSILNFEQVCIPPKPPWSLHCLEYDSSKVALMLWTPLSVLSDVVQLRPIPWPSFSEYFADDTLASCICPMQVLRYITYYDHAYSIGVVVPCHFTPFRHAHAVFEESSDQTVKMLLPSLANLVDIVPWPQQVQSEVTEDKVQLRPVPWPSFLNYYVDLRWFNILPMVVVGSAMEVQILGFCQIDAQFKASWPPPCQMNTPMASITEEQQVIRWYLGGDQYFLEESESVECLGELHMKPPWPPSARQNFSVMIVEMVQFLDCMQKYGCPCPSAFLQRFELGNIGEGPNCQVSVNVNSRTIFSFYAQLRCSVRSKQFASITALPRLEVTTSAHSVLPNNWLLLCVHFSSRKSAQVLQRHISISSNTSQTCASRMWFWPIQTNQYYVVLKCELWRCTLDVHLLGYDGSVDSNSNIRGTEPFGAASSVQSATSTWFHGTYAHKGEGERNMVYIGDGVIFRLPRLLQLAAAPMVIKAKFLRNSYLQTPWDPGGDLHRLEGKPNFKKGGMLVTHMGCHGPWASASRLSIGRDYKERAAQRWRDGIFRTK